MADPTVAVVPAVDDVVEGSRSLLFTVLGSFVFMLFLCVFCGVLWVRYTRRRAVPRVDHELIQF